MKIDLRRFDCVASTQDICRELAQGGAGEGVVIVAEGQTAGRGRAGTAWYSPPGQAIYASILLRPRLAVPQVSWITMIAALAVTDGIHAVGVETRIRRVSTPTIKWFNDIVLDAKKVCGILVETAITDDRLDYAILGMGLNVNTDFAEAPVEVRARATSLREAWGFSHELKLDRDAVLNTVLAQFVQHYEALIDTQSSPARAYAKRLDTLGKWVCVQSGDDIIEGLAHNIDDLGGLCIRTAQGERIAYFGHVLSAVSPQ